MPELVPIKRRDLIRYLRNLGFEGPYSGKRHRCDRLSASVENSEDGRAFPGKPAERECC